MPVRGPSLNQAALVNASVVKLLSTLAPTALPYLAKGLQAFAKFPVLIKVVVRAADMAAKSKKPHDPRALGRALTAAASEVANEALTDEYMSFVPVRSRRKRRK